MYMFKYILKRIGLALMTFAIITVICFVLIKSEDIVINITPGKTREALENLLKARGYYKPIPEQLWLYVKRIITEGDWGVAFNYSEFSGRKVWDVFVEMLPPTCLINLYSSLIAVPIGIALGIYAALKKNKWQDTVISTGIIVFVSVPSFVYASLVLYILCFKVKNPLPKTMNPGYDYFTWDMFKSMFPAVLSLSFGSIAGYARYTRAELTEVLTSEFMLLARTKGLTKGQATIRHALRNSMVPIFPSIIGEIISIMSGSLIIENIFSIPGVGKLYLGSINTLDYDFFMLLSVFYTFIGLLAGIVIDISYGIIDPRIRMGAR